MFFQISLTILILCAGINFFRFSTGDLSIVRDRMGRSENKNDKVAEYKAKHVYRPIHEKHYLRNEPKEHFVSKIKNYFYEPRRERVEK